MAKINSRGDSAAQVWTGPNGRRMVWTHHGRLLMRYAGTRRYAILRTECSRAEAERIASASMLTTVEVYS